MEASTNCFFVVVGGKYLRLMNKVRDIVDNVTEDVGRRPLTVFYVTKDEKITSFHDQPFQLPLVNKLKSSILNTNICCQAPSFSRYLYPFLRESELTLL